MSLNHAGWHPLHSDATTLRYWDGQQWTNYYRHWDGHQWVEGVRPAPEQHLHHPHQPYQTAAQRPARNKRLARNWLVPTAVAVLLVLGTGGLFYGTVIYEAPPEVVEASGNVDGMLTGGQIEPIVNGEIRNALTSHVVYTDTAKGLDYTQPIVDIEDRDGKIWIPMDKEGLKIENVPDWAKPHARVDDFGESIDWAVRMFADPDLTIEVGISYTLQRDHMLINAQEYVHGAQPRSLDYIDVGGPPLLEDDIKVRENDLGGWGMRDTYYVVRYVSDDGEKTPLERPVVSKLSFTQSLPTPEVRAGVSAESPGSIELTWQSVPGASSYGVFMSHAGPDMHRVHRQQYLLGVTEDTAWVADVDSEAPESVYQNFNMNTGEYGADDDDFSLGTEYGVIAYDASGAKMSAIGSVSANDPAIEHLPYHVDFDLVSEWEDERECVATEDCTFADSLAFAPYISVGGDVREALVVATGLSWDSGWDSFAAVMELEGTRLVYKQYMPTQDEAEAAEWIEEFNEAASGERLPTGALDVVRKAEVIENAVAQSDVDPAVLDEVNTMDHELVAYIAAHMYEGTTAIDMSNYADFWSHSDIYQAASVAHSQNPHVGAWAWAYDSYEDALHIEYENRERSHQAQAEIVSILDDLGVESMSESAKVTAINNYIVDNIEYNYDAIDAKVDGQPSPDYRYAWTLDGAVLDGLVVCSGYAQMFQTMATEAGLESVYVSGTVSGSLTRHAWNKVKVDGEWKIVDTTWNDSPYGNQYLLVNDGGLPRGEVRTEDTHWLMGDLSQYATP